MSDTIAPITAYKRLRPMRKAILGFVSAASFTYNTRIIAKAAISSGENKPTNRIMIVALSA